MTQYQLTLGDYFKVNDIAAEIAAQATELIGWLNNHGKVRVIFNQAQQEVSKDRTGFVKVLVYLVANLTRWTTHYIAFRRLFILKTPLQFAVLRDRQAIIRAQIGAAKGRERDELEESTEHSCDQINNQRFWSGLEMVLEDIEPITFGTNINQKDSTRPDQVFLTIAGIYIHFSAHPEPAVRQHMCARLEKRWKDCDQLLFILALILNPYKGLSAFGENAGLNSFNLQNMLISVCYLHLWPLIPLILSRLYPQLYKRVRNRPDNLDTPAQRAEKEKAVSTAFFQYLATTGAFKEFAANKDTFKESMVCPPFLFSIFQYSIIPNAGG